MLSTHRKTMYTEDMASEVKQFAEFLKRFPTRHFSKGEIIIFQGEAPRAAYVVQSGIVKAYNISVQGDEKPVGFYGPQEAFPAAWTFGKAPNAYFYFEAFTDTELSCVPRDEYVQFVKTNPRYAYAALEQSIVDSVGTTMRLNALQHSRASDKLLYTLHYLTLTHGRANGNKQIEITLNLTHQDFANLTGLTRETAATELNKLKGAGVISYGKHTLYQVRLDKLRDVINDQFIADVQVTR